ncbi:MAG: hypothetical protein QOG62_430 [Thermoleophilaceae bacterium]|jgi:hypothetical protein|nr:hypothetical protein [Thermoleophilaceae bacterium]
MTDEDPGILGNLPRSRPGTRSDKRGGAPTAKPKAAAPAKKPAAVKAKAAAKPKAAPKPTAKPPPPQRRPEPQAQPGGIDPVGDILRAGEAIARSGLRVGSALAGEALRRFSGR